MKNNNQKIFEYLEKERITYIQNFNVSNRSWLKAGGIIRTYITPENADQVAKILNFLDKERCNFYTLGNISNTIIRDGMILTPIINLSKINSIKIINNDKDLKIYVDAGVSIPRFANFIINQEYLGAEGLLGIPGSVGGGIFMNASCYNNALTNYITKIFSMNENGKIIERNKKESDFNWRNSKFQDSKEIILGANFVFPFINKLKLDLIKIKSEKIKLHRKNIQESEYPNLGSLFATKNLYSDIKFKSINFFLIFIYYKIFSILIKNNFLRNSDIVIFRKKINKIYRKHMKIVGDNHFTLSDKTINCLINRGSKSSVEAINLINKLKMIIGKKIKLENIVLDKIK